MKISFSRKSDLSVWSYICAYWRMFVQLCVCVYIKIDIYLWIFRNESDCDISEFVLLKPVFVKCLYRFWNKPERLQSYVILQKVVCCRGLKHSSKTIYKLQLYQGTWGCWCLESSHITLKYLYSSSSRLLWA